jgi:hypothetical protein
MSNTAGLSRSVNRRQSTTRKRHWLSSPRRIEAAGPPLPQSRGRVAAWPRLDGKRSWRLRHCVRLETVRAKHTDGVSNWALYALPNVMFDSPPIFCRVNVSEPSSCSARPCPLPDLAERSTAFVAGPTRTALIALPQFVRQALSAWTRS